MRSTHRCLVGIGAVVAMAWLGQVAAQELESARDYCGNTQDYEIGGKEYRECYTRYIWAHCDGKGEKPGTPGHHACMKKLVDG